MKRICWDIFIFSAMRHLKEIVLCQWLFGNSLSVWWLQAQLVSFLALTSTINLVIIGLRASSLVKVSLHLMPAFLLLTSNSSSLVWPVFEAITSSTPQKLWVFKADCIELLLGRWLRYRWVMTTHVYSKVFNTSDGLLPVKCLLRIVDLRQIWTHIAACGSYLEWLFLVENGSSFPTLSILLRCRCLLGREQSTLFDYLLMVLFGMLLSYGWAVPTLLI